MRKLCLWVVFAIAGPCVVHAGSSAQPQSSNGALTWIEIGGAAPNLDAEAPDAPVVVAAPAPAVEPARAGNPLWAIPLSALSATRDRPLFSSSRRPPTPPPVAAAPSPPPLARVLVTPAPPFTLVGTIIGGKIRMGVFLNEDSKIVMRIRKGEADSGWTVRSVDPRKAVLESDGRMATLDMPEPGSAANAGAAANTGVAHRRSLGNLSPARPDFCLPRKAQGVTADETADPSGRRA